MKKIKISELPLCKTLKGLFTIGTDAENKSVKVSLEFIEEDTNAAIEHVKAETGKAIKESQEATADAKAMTAELAAKLASLVPDSLSVECITTITWGNKKRIPIKAILKPDSVMQNIIYISDNRAVDVSADGFITAIEKGASRVQVIPTMNTALTKTCLIEVGDPQMRIATLERGIRLTQSGGLRLL